MINLEVGSLIEIIKPIYVYKETAGKLNNTYRIGKGTFLTVVSTEMITEEKKLASTIRIYAPGVRLFFLHAEHGRLLCWVPASKAKDFLDCFKLVAT